MIVLRFVFTVTILHHVFHTEAIELPNILKSLTGEGRSAESKLDNDSASTPNPTDDQADGLSQSIIKEIKCSEVRSNMGRATKWLLMATSNDKRMPKVRFYMSSSTMPDRVKVRLGDRFSLNGTDFTAERRTVLIVHGFLSGGFRKWVAEMKDAFRLWGDVNMVVVDWSVGFRSWNYYQAATRTKGVGNIIARFLHQLMNATRIAKSPLEPTWGTLHFVGHSLGAHISGFAANYFTEMQHDWPVSRISGLDPAGLCFRDVSNDFRLARTDANFVDVIHTSADTNSAMGFGISEPTGHVDFFVNGGKMQPGCSERSTSVSAYLGVWLNSLVDGSCNHQRAVVYFTESLIGAAMGNCSYPARQWNRNDSNIEAVLSKVDDDDDTCMEMGIRSENHPQRGVFYVATSESKPFCIPTAAWHKSITNFFSKF